MGSIHQLILEKGKSGALREVLDRRVVEAAVSYLSAQEPGIGFAFDGWAQVALPHRRLPDDAAWRIRSGDATLTVEPGRRVGANGRLEFIGVPYGSRARLIILYIQSEALRTGGREIVLGNSLRAWMNRLGIPLGGKSMHDVREQTERILRCRVTFELARQRCHGLIHQHIVDEAMFDGPQPRSSDFGNQPRSGAVGVERILLCQTFFDRLMRHAIPIEASAVRAIANNSMAIDIYIWLTHYLPRLTRERLLPWRAVQDQFGTRFARRDHFRARFSENLGLALAVLRDADVAECADGLILRPPASTGHSALPA